MSAPRFVTDRTRPAFPLRAVVTGGMPYGNKDLHFGHIGGVFIHADAFCRFLRDRLGRENVIFVSGTDCYGSPIVEYHRGAVERGEFSGSLEEFAAYNHQRQHRTLAAYSIDLDLFAASAFGRPAEIHRAWGAMLLEKLHAHGHVEKSTTPQFYDSERDTFLNGRQVRGRCPVSSCKSEQAYADECSLGHQYEPKDLIKPRSVLSGEKPEMRDVTNWYLKVPAFRGLLEPLVESLKESDIWRRYSISNIQEYFEPPIIHVTRDQLEALEPLAASLPAHTRQPGRKKSVQLVFESLPGLEQAVGQLAAAGIRYRTGKTLVPFRLTGNLDWGLPAPEIEGLSELTFWVWPESLWAPISFTAAVLEERGGSCEDWKEWWSSKEAGVYQFIGEDNIYFYSLPQMTMFLGLQGPEPVAHPPEGQLQMTTLIANRHLMFLDKKASSSGSIRPPMARELLDYYTSDQLRAHFVSLALGQRSIGFRPKPLNPKAKEKDGDPVLKDGNLLSNTFNRAVRSCFYTTQKFYGDSLPAGEPSREVVEQSETAILDFEQAMARVELHTALTIAGDFVRSINKRWSLTRPFADDCEPEQRAQALVDAFHMVRVGAVLLHPIAPVGTEMIAEYLQVADDFFSWERVFEPLAAFVQPGHTCKHLPPRVDFFPKHASQFSS